jgi:hypothetical protein
MKRTALLLVALWTAPLWAQDSTNPVAIVIQAVMFQCPKEVARDLFPDPLVAGRTYEITEETVQRINALEDQKKLRVLCRPQVSTISGVQAQVRAVREFLYAAEVSVEGDAVTPSFRTREVGTILNVTPTIGTDLQTINVTLVPEYSELAEMRKVPIALPDSRYRTEIELPIFKTYNVQTSVVLTSGRPVVLCVFDPVENADPRTTNATQILSILTATIRYSSPPKK